MDAAVLSNNFTGGEVSPRIWQRPEVSKVKNGCRTIVNGIVTPHGGIYKRSGTKFVVELPSTARHRYIRFQSAQNRSYTLIFGNQFVWFCSNSGILTHAAKTITAITQASPAVVTSASHGYSNGDKVLISSVGGMTELNNRWFKVQNVATNTFELFDHDGSTPIDSSGYDAYTSGGTGNEIVELTTTYTSAQVAEIQTQQINDVMYLVHQEHPPRKLVRTSDTSWTLSEPAFDSGPFDVVNTDDVTMTPSSFSASATAYGTHVVGTTFTLTASSGYFTADHVGAYFRLYEEGGSSGISGAPIGDATQALSNGGVYTYQGNIYGVNNVTGASNWAPYGRVPEHTSGVSVVSSGTNSFESAFLHPGYCVIQITAYASATSVTATIVRYQMAKSVVTSGTTYWQEGAWSDERGWPRAITLHDQRLWFGGTDADPTVIWGSRSGIYEDFEDGDEDDDAIVYRMASGQRDVIRWMSGRRTLICGTSQGESAAAASSQQESLSPSNVKVVMQTDVGSSDCIPVEINQAVLYAQRQGDPENAAIALREFAYSFSEDRFNSPDLTIFAEHVFGPGIDRLGYIRSPESVIWARRTDGVLAACTYEREQEVVSWHRHAIAGADATVEEFTTKAGAAGDEVWLQVNRTIDGAEVAYVEVIQPRFREGQTAKEDAWMLDCALRYEGSATSTISGLWHLRGEALTVFNNGHREDVTVGDDGRISLATPSTKAAIGYCPTMVIELSEFEAGAQMGTARTRPKNLSAVHIAVVDSHGGSVGTSAANQRDLVYRIESDPMDDSPPLVTQWIETDVSSSWEDEQVLRIEHSEPFPFMMSGVVAEMAVVG